MYIISQRSTKFVLGLICLLNTMWSLEKIVQCLFMLNPKIDQQQLSHIFSMMESFLSPLFASIQRLYVVYSIHRYAIITSKALMLTRFTWMIIIVCFTIFIVYATESLHILDDFLYTDRKYQKFVGVIFSGFMVLKLLLDVIFTSVHVFVLRSISKTLTESANFLRSLNPTDNIMKRIIAIADILKFNQALLFLQVSLPLFEIIRLSVLLGIWAGTCSNCSGLALAFFILDCIQNNLGAVQSTVFALIHLRYMRIFSCGRQNNETE